METTESADQAFPRNTRQPSALACIACRSRHLKCSGQKPICRRCRDNGSDCSYKQSRRGYKGPRKTQAKVGGINASNDDQTSLTSNAFNIASPAALSNFDYDPFADISSGIGEDVSVSMLQDQGNIDTASNIGQDQSTQYNGFRDVALRSSAFQYLDRSEELIIADDGFLLDVFYASFNNAHPFLIPQRMYRANPPLIPPHLKTVMQFVASHFMSTVPQENVRRAAENITSDHTSDDGHKVQGLILLGMALFSHSEQQFGVTIFDQAITLALQLGMNMTAFATRHGMSNAVIEESWRRTWWELYMVDGILASLNSVPHMFRLQHVRTDMPLPYDDAEYAQCTYEISPQRSQAEFLERSFAVETYEYSSMAYKIEAVRLLGKVISLGEDVLTSSSDNVETLDASLVNFILSLPADKRHNLEREGKVDEVLFMAHSIIDCAFILLHRPRSTLISVRNHYSTHCTRDEAIKAPASAYEIHTSKAIKAANSISTLVAVRTPLVEHSPCFMCAIAMAAVVHLPAYTQEQNREKAAHIRERLQLSVSALNSIGQVWPSAKAAKGHIAQYAREVFAAQKAGGDAPRVESQVQQIEDESMMNDQNWLNDLVNFNTDETAMMSETPLQEQLLPVEMSPTVCHPDETQTWTK